MAKGHALQEPASSFQSSANDPPLLTCRCLLQGKPLLRSFHDATGAFHKELADWQCAIDDRLPTLAQVRRQSPFWVAVPSSPPPAPRVLQSASVRCRTAHGDPKHDEQLRRQLSRHPAGICSGAGARGL